MSRGRFITFEGTEGSGKSTQVRLLADKLVSAGHEVDVTREPGGTPLGESIRELLLAESGSLAHPRTQALLHTAARAEHVAKRIEPDLHAGIHVLCDRFSDSTLAYQGGGLGVPIADLRDLQQFAVDACEPDLRILLLLSSERGRVDRLGARHDRNWIDNAGPAFHSRVQAVFADLARESPSQWLVIEGDKTIEYVHRVIVDGVRSRFVEFQSL